jgi:poly-gamma-glutamate synthesis protein (capsule biosynthesis protein)
LATANNHSCDKHKKGIESTIQILDSLQILHFGTFLSHKAKDSLTPLILHQNNIKIALLNYTYGTNGIPVPWPTVVNLIDTKVMKKDIEKAQKNEPDAIIAFLHWGNQYQNKPSKQQLKTEKFLRTEGVNYIIGAHPHVVQPINYEYDAITKKTYFTAYSLGNFVSNQRKFPRDGSMILHLKFVKTEDGLKLDSYHTIPIWVYKYKQNKKWNYEILPVEQFILNPTYFEQNADYQKMMHYYKHYKKIVLNQ